MLMLLLMIVPTTDYRLLTTDYCLPRRSLGEGGTADY
jgi:hypothetical protein